MISGGWGGRDRPSNRPGEVSMKLLLGTSSLFQLCALNLLTTQDQRSSPKVISLGSYLFLYLLEPLSSVL